MENKNQRRNGGYSIFHEHEFPALPISVVKLYDQSLEALVSSKKAIAIHDGSRPHRPFDNSVIVQSRKYKKSYEVHVADVRILIILIFDERDDKNIGYIHISEKGRQLLKEHGLLDISN